MKNSSAANDPWPPLPLNEWQDTYATLHMWTQIVGKIRLAQAPPLNHWWNVPLYVTARGLTTSAMPYSDRSFQIDFDFIDHQLLINSSDGAATSFPLAPRSVADFYRELMRSLKEMGIMVKIWAVPVEIPDPVPFEKDHTNASYDPDAANRFWLILARTAAIMSAFRGRFLGKSSPVHFFWGSFDLAVTRFSGKLAPPRENADLIMREAYSHECISAGFWPGVRMSGAAGGTEQGGIVHAPAFYSYTAPEPEGLNQARIRPDAAFYSPSMKEFILLYDDVRAAPSPDAAVMEFLQSTYEAGANLAKWDRAALERASIRAPG